MTTDTLHRSTAALASAAAFLALTLGLAGDTEAQDLVLTQGDLESSLSNPDQVIQQLKQERGVKAVTFVGIGDVLKSQEEVERIQQEHRQGIEAFRQALREDDRMLQNLQRQLKNAEYRAEDVIAIHVATRATPGEREADQQRQQTAAHETIYIVVPGTLYPGTPGGQDEPGRDTARSDTSPQDSLPR